MAVFASAADFHVGDLFVDIGDPGVSLVLKCEAMNFAGSIKLKTARRMIDEAELLDLIRPGDTLVESSSGNLGIALAVVCAARGYQLIVVTDDRCSDTGIRMMRALGAGVEVVTEPHPTQGLLGARWDRVRMLLAEDPSRTELNQYHNEANWQAHYATTGAEIAEAFDDLAHVFVGVGTSGTAMGVARYLRHHRPEARVIGVDVHGSVSLGGPPAARHIPGLGAAIVPPMLRVEELHGVVMVSEQATVAACRSLLGRGLLMGGSTGSILAGARSWLAEHPHRDGVNVVVAPDLGERYLGTVYDSAWVAQRLDPSVDEPGLVDLPLVRAAVSS